MTQRTFLDRVKWINSDIINGMTNEELEKVMAEIPDFTEKDLVKLNKLKAKLEKTIDKNERAEIKREVDKLQFYKAADTHRDFALDDDFPEYDRQHLIIAMKDYVIAKNL